MERRKFLFTLCGVGAAAVGATAVGTASAQPPGLCKVINATNRSIYLKIVGPFPGGDWSPPRGGILFPEEEYLENLGEGKRVVIAWDHLAENILTMKEVKVFPRCQIDVYEGDVVVTYEL